jgi:hypothetical protein
MLVRDVTKLSCCQEYRNRESRSRDAAACSMRTQAARPIGKYPYTVEDSSKLMGYLDGRHN